MVRSCRLGLVSGDSKIVGRNLHSPFFALPYEVIRQFRKLLPARESLETAQIKPRVRFLSYFLAIILGS